MWASWGQIIVQFVWLKDNVSAAGTLEVTEDQQYRESGLLHISDEALLCFKILQNPRVQQMNLSRLAGSNLKAMDN